MSKKVQIHVPEPCGENWEKMADAGNGRFCNACSKTVIDFTPMSDQQVLSYLGDRNKKVCGRFAPDQLNRDFRMSQEGGRRPWSVVWRLALVGMLLSARVQAQHRYPKAAMSKLVKKKAKTKIVKGEVEDVTMGITIPIIDPDTLKVSIVDSVTHQPVSYAMIRNLRSQQIFTTDSSGEFNLEGIGGEGAGELEISCVGYEIKKIRLNREMMRQKELMVSLAPHITLLPDVTVTSYGITKGRVTLVGAVVPGVKVEKFTPMDTVRRLLSDTLVFCGIRPRPITVYPNPATRGTQVNLSLNLDRHGSYNLGLFNAAGALIEERQIEMAGKSQTASFPVPATLPAGIYFLKVSYPGSDIKLHTQKLVVL